MKILLVNGLMHDLSGLRAALGPDHEVWLATGPKPAERLYRQFKPDAVVLMAKDLNPAHPNLVRAFREASGAVHRPIVALAPFTHLKIVQQVLDWGIDAFLTSPCDMARVKKRLLSLLEDERIDHLTLH